MTDCKIAIIFVLHIVFTWASSTPVLPNLCPAYKIRVENIYTYDKCFCGTDPECKLTVQIFSDANEFLSSFYIGAPYYVNGGNEVHFEGCADVPHFKVKLGYHLNQADLTNLTKLTTLCEIPVPYYLPVFSTEWPWRGLTNTRVAATSREEFVGECKCSASVRVLRLPGFGSCLMPQMHKITLLSANVHDSYCGATYCSMDVVMYDSHGKRIAEYYVGEDTRFFQAEGVMSPLEMCSSIPAVINILSRNGQNHEHSKMICSFSIMPDNLPTPTISFGDVTLSKEGTNYKCSVALFVVSPC